MKDIDLIAGRFENWEGTRGAYIMSQKYRDELRDYLFKGNAKGLSKFSDNFLLKENVEDGLKKFFLNVKSIGKEGKITLSKEYFEEFCEYIGVTCDEKN